MTSNEEMIKTHDPSFDGLSSGQYIGDFPRTVHINETNWLAPPKCWRKKNAYREYVILHEVIHTRGLDHPKTKHLKRSIHCCPVIYPQTKCWKLKLCKANHRMDPYTRKQIKTMWEKDTKRLLQKFVRIWIRIRINDRFDKFVKQSLSN